MLIIVNSEFTELSSIYENTEEEMCTPDRELKFDYSSFNDYKKIRVNRLDSKFNSVTGAKAGTLPNFFERMDTDVRERNLRDYEFKEIFKKPILYPPYDKKLTKKSTKSIVERLHTTSKNKGSSRLGTSQSVKSLNSSSSQTSILGALFSSSKKKKLQKHRLSVVSLSTKPKLITPVKEKITSQERKANFLKKLLPVKSTVKKKEKQLIEKVKKLQKLKAQAELLEKEIQLIKMDTEQLDTEIIQSTKSSKKVIKRNGNLYNKRGSMPKIKLRKY